MGLLLFLLCHGDICLGNKQGKAIYAEPLYKYILSIKALELFERILFQVGGAKQWKKCWESFFRVIKKLR
jgi:hypothetical protein